VLTSMVCSSTLLASFSTGSMAIVSSMLENLKFVQNITLFLVHTDHLFPNKVMKKMSRKLVHICTRHGRFPVHSKTDRLGIVQSTRRLASTTAASTELRFRQALSQVKRRTFTSKAKFVWKVLRITCVTVHHSILRPDLACV
jgi:hypothetical protein